MPNEQGGFTYEEEQEWIARQMATANFQPSPEVNPTPEQQNQQVAANMAAALQSQNAEQGILDTMQTMVYGLGPPYSESPRPYAGPEPMEAQPDWNYDSGFPGNWHDYSSNNTTGGGFFNIDELYHAQGRAVPDIFQSGSNLPSTNNYRLLPPDYRQPRYIMRNGQIIDLNSDTIYGPYGHGETGGRYENPRWRSGSGLRVPGAHAFGSIAGTVFGWPGALQYGYINPAT